MDGVRCLPRPTFLDQTHPRLLPPDTHRYQQLTTFEGYSENEVIQAERALGNRFPEFYRNFLLEMGKSPGELFCGSDYADLSELNKFKDAALELMAETDPDLTLPGDSVVFLFHQGSHRQALVP